MKARFLAALLLLGSAAASAAPPSKIALRIAPEVDSQYPQIRSQIAASRVAEVAEPAELLLTTGDELNDYAELDPVDGSKFNIVRLGKLANRETQAALPRVLALMQRQKALIALGNAPTPSGIETCNVDRENPGPCLKQGQSGISPGLPSTAIHNRSDRPRYVAVFETRSDLGIKAVALREEQSIVRLTPGERIVVAPPRAGAEGASDRVVIVSDKPFDPSRFEQPASLGSSVTCFVRLYPECVANAPPLPSFEGLSAIAFEYKDIDREYDVEGATVPAMGGGMPVTRGSADWMVEIYATHDYTAQQIADDRKLPAAKQQHLWERSPEELAHTCGGTMIGRDLVLTAAHCVATGIFLSPNENRVFAARRVRVGSLLLGRGGETRAIVGMVVHQGYTGQGTGLPNDIALLMLKSDEPIRLGVRSLKVTSTFPKNGSTLAGLGWGFTQATAADGNINMNTHQQVQRNPSLLQMAPLQVIGADDCNKRMDNKLRPGMLCLVTPASVAGRGGPATFSCRGDSGGPLVRNYMGDSEELVGLTSWSIGCGYKPSVYTDVAYFSAWVDAARKAIRPGAVIRIGDPPRNP